MLMRKPAFVIGTVLIAALFSVPHTARAQGSPTVALLTKSADALGGLKRVQAVKNISLQGYGQYAYMFGGGNITASPNAPQKYQAANDLRRVYDLEHNRFQQLERRNMLFPFAAVFGHNYAQVNLVLDGDIAYEAGFDGKLKRSLRWIESPLQLDGLHMRRMLMLNNPIAAVRAALDPSSSLSNLRVEHGASLIDMTLKAGDKITLAIDNFSSLPAFVRWANPDADLGQVTFTTYFTGYVPYGDFLLPLGYKTTLDWRNIDYFKLYVDTYEIDGKIADLAAPDAIRNAPEPVAPVPEVKATPVAKGIWHLTGGTTVFEFKDHLTLFELGNNPALAQAVVDFAKKMVPGKLPTQLIISHAHFDHLAGLRVGVAAGLTIIGRRGNEVILKEMASHPSPDYPDALEKNKKPLKFIPVDEHLKFADDTMQVDVYWARNNTHMADAVFAYAPATKVMAEGDIATAAFDYQFWADNYMDDIEHYKLDVQMLSPVHMEPMKQADVIELLKGGVGRTRERCASELAKGNYFPGCPVVTKRY
jgi:glyoxylase-like metal-dependent hydrolase (beta-lactamase superfamily II)